MRKSMAGLLFGVWAACAAQAAELTDTEQRWLRGISPVLAFARGAGLPVDVVVQPQPTPGLPPIALAYLAGRCKLVLSMRGNPEVQAALQRIEPDLLDATLELMAAHEMGHCQRHVDGAWRSLPSGQTQPIAGQADRPEEQDQQAVRREEGYADLAGLAWTREHHAPLYARLHTWLMAERSLALVPGSAHDTRLWAGLARDERRLAGPDMFKAAAALWAVGLAAKP